MCKCITPQKIIQKWKVELTNTEDTTKNSLKAPIEIPYDIIIERTCNYIWEKLYYLKPLNDKFWIPIDRYIFEANNKIHIESGDFEESIISEVIKRLKEDFSVERNKNLPLFILISTNKSLLKAESTEQHICKTIKAS